MNPRWGPPTSPATRCPLSPSPPPACASGSLRAVAPRAGRTLCGWPRWRRMGNDGPRPGWPAVKGGPATRPGGLWRDRGVLITGASGGSGRALAVELGRWGARVGLLARGQDGLQAAAAAVEAAGGAARVLPGDVTRLADVRRAVDRIAAEWGGIDVLVANAGVA